MTAHKTQRADALMLAQGLCESRAQAQQLIAAGKLLYEGVPVDKPSRKLPETALLTLTASMPYVSRAGEKLEAALDAFAINPEGLYALDVGASTGGFTDCLLKRGALHVTCVDVGHAQLHPRLLGDIRVHNIEGLNARELTQATLPYPHYPLIVTDLSFISLTLVLEAMHSRLAKNGVLIALIKPQFEAGKENIGKNGIVTSPAAREAALARVLNFAQSLKDLQLIGQAPSPIQGTDGNHEYLAAWRRSDQT